MLTPSSARPLLLAGVLALLLVATASSASVLPAAQHQLPPHHLAQPQPQLTTPLDEQVFFERCSQELGSDWIKYDKACYRYFEAAQYWYVAEQECRSKYRGHLVSVADRAENGFVGKLTYCQKTWLGRYGVDADRSSQPEGYRWTDDTRSQYHAHNFTNAQLHHPLIYAKDLQWFNDVYHAKQGYVCKVPTAHRNYTCNCPSGWKELNGYCYYMPSFEATYIEGDYFCRGKNAYLASVHNEQELRIMSLLDVDNYGCPPDAWLGLVKLNPCRDAYNVLTGNKVCYRWSDRSGEHSSASSVLKWSPGHPINDLATNCVLLRERKIQTVPCHTRAKFVCKKKVGL